MLPFFPLFVLAQATPSEVYIPEPPPPPPRLSHVVESQEVRPLPGQLDSVPVFNSNSPELVQQEGILLSTFPPQGMRVPSAHLNYAFEGRFDVFAHHIAKGRTPTDVRTLYIGVLAYNPSDRPVTIQVLQSASYLSQEAPFYDLPSYVANAGPTVFAGPGSRTMGDILRGLSQRLLPERVTVPPKYVQLLLNEPIPLRSLQSYRNGEPLPQIDPEDVGLDAAEAAEVVQNGAPRARRPPTPRNATNLPINGRSALLYLSSDGPVHLASLGMFAKVNGNGTERSPRMEEWLTLLQQGGVAGPRDRTPSPPNARQIGRFYYGRVSGVSQGSRWDAVLTDGEGAENLTIPQRGSAISYAISTVDRHTLGTGQIQSAPMLARYADTAYRAHGNYGTRYNLTLPLYNNTEREQTVALLFQTPMKDESLRGQALRFLNPPDRRVFFRGTLRLQYVNDWGVTQTRYVHVVQRRGQQGEPLLTLNLRRGDRRPVQVEFLYPPDATPPQALTIQTLAPGQAPRTAPQEESGTAVTLESSPQP
ncbi:MAG: DUF3370 domain-containing protein [Cyanobacteria bacterium J069]|nr:MAG: DUF3370 domain-containing protein [Cyanobacteria bacterium J069]